MAAQSVQIHAIYLSPGHDFKGHHGRPRGNHPVDRVEEARLVAGQGIEGDRYFGHKENFKGQATFFDWSVYQKAKIQLNLANLTPKSLRRNILIEGVELNGLIGKQFEISGILFEGTEECSPCYWMDQEVAPGLEAYLQNRGGLRVRILRDGVLHTGQAYLNLPETTLHH